MNIVALDGHALNPGDLSWDGFQTLGDLQVFDRTPEGEIVPRLEKAEIALTNKVPFSRATLEKLPRLKYIGVLATGYNIIDVTAAREGARVVTNVPSYGTTSVAQAVFALLLELTNNAAGHARSVREGRWTASRDFCYWLSPQVELAGLTMGIVGFGRIGQNVAKIAAAFDMQVIVHTGSRGAAGHDLVDLDTLFARSDVISLHCPLTPETQKLVNAHRLAQMKRSAFLINTSRGALVDEPALAAALNNGWIGGAGLDVLSSEPPPADNLLLKAKNCIVTPHIAWATHAARSRLMNIAVDNLKSYLAGAPTNVVS